MYPHPKLETLLSSMVQTNSINPKEFPVLWDLHKDLESSDAISSIVRAVARPLALCTEANAAMSNGPETILDYIAYTLKDSNNIDVYDIYEEYVSTTKEIKQFTLNIFQSACNGILLAIKGHILQNST